MQIFMIIIWIVECTSSPLTSAVLLDGGSHLVVCYLELATRGHITRFYDILFVYKFLGPNLPQD